MDFIRVEGVSELETALILALNAALAKKETVLWLVPGGSNIKTAVAVMSHLEVNNLVNLTIALTDERYGEPGHADSNFLQLHQNGLETRGATFLDLLDGSPFEETVARASRNMEILFKREKIIVGYFGMGADGHIAGILPHSPAAVSDETWMVGYDGGQFQRFTLTPFALSHVQQAFVGAYGVEKLQPLTTLQNKMVPVTEQPAQILRHIPEVSIFNDQLGDSL